MFDYEMDEEIDNVISGLTSYDLKDKLSSSNYDGSFVNLMEYGTDLKFEDIQKNGFKVPIKIKNKIGLGEFGCFQNCRIIIFFIILL